MVVRPDPVDNAIVSLLLCLTEVVVQDTIRTKSSFGYLGMKPGQ